MIRAPNLEVRVRCPNCKELTKSVEQIIIKKVKGNRFYFTAACVFCNSFNNNYLNRSQVNILPYEIKNAPDNTTFSNIIEKEGKTLPLLALIPTIAAGITALPVLGGTVASNVIQANNESA
jgi:hypothetical protein